MTLAIEPGGRGIQTRSKPAWFIKGPPTSQPHRSKNKKKKARIIVEKKGAVSERKLPLGREKEDALFCG